MLGEIQIRDVAIKGGDDWLRGCAALTVMFLNLDMKRVRTGIENSALLRAKVFELHLGILPQILTVSYDAHFAETKSELCRTGLVTENAKFLNMYGYFQDVCSNAETIEASKPEAALAETWRVVPVAGTPDTRVYDDKNQCIMYWKHSRQTGSLEYINFLHKGKRWRRDTYATQGFLSRIQFLDVETGDSIYEHYLRPDGSVALIHWFSKDGGERKLSKVQLINRHGVCTQEFGSREELVTHWLMSVTSEPGRRYMLISDKNRIFFQSLRQLKNQPRGAKHVSVIPVVHAVHTKDARNVMCSKTNVNYASILEDIQWPDAVVVLTERQKRHILSRYGQGNIQVIPHSFEATGKPMEFEGRDRFRVVYLARYSPEKNHALAIRAFASVVREIPEATLHCYGNGSGMPALREQIKSLGLEKSIQLHNFVQDVAALYASAGLSILPSQGEGYPLVVLESLCHGCPVVAFDINYGPAEMIEDGETGFLIPFGDEVLLAQRIADVLRDPGRHRRMCENACRSSSRFGAKAAAEKWKQLIRDVATPQARSHAKMTTGKSMELARAALDQLGFGTDVPIWFDWLDRSLCFAFPSSFMDSSTLDQRKALEEACRVLKLVRKETLPGPDYEAIIGSRMKSTTNALAGSAAREPHGNPTETESIQANAPGATDNIAKLAQTQHLRRTLPKLLSDLHVRTLLDLPCGDFHWMRYVPLTDIDYVGADFVDDLVQRNQRLFGSKRTNFVRLDVLCDQIPHVDLILCRDCLGHFPHAEVRIALENLCRSGSQWLLTTTFPGRQFAADVAKGKWRPLNLESAPFYLPPPVTLIVEQCTEGNGRFADKSLGLWHLRDVATALGVDNTDRHK